MWFPSRYFPLFVGIVCLTLLAGVAALFFVRLHRLGARWHDTASVRAEVRRILQSAWSTGKTARADEIAAHQSRTPPDEALAAVVEKIGERMSELGAPLWGNQAAVLQRALASEYDGGGLGPLISDAVLGETGPGFSPRQKQILALVQAELRLAESMQSTERRAKDTGVSRR